MAKRAEDWAKDKTGDILLNGVKDFSNRINWTRTQQERAIRKC